MYYLFALYVNGHVITHRTNARIWIWIFSILQKIWEIRTVKYCDMTPKVGIVEPEKISIAR
jgi:hypothetical protein